MQKIYVASGNLFTLTAEADRVLCHLEMFSIVFFHWMYSCFQDSSVIPGWFVYWVLVEKCTACQSHRKSDFGWQRFRFPPCLMLNRVEKSQAILALLDSFQELHLDW